MKVGVMVWKTCPECGAVNSDPLPEGWSYTVQSFDEGISHVYVHDVDCPRRFKKIDIPDA